MSILLNCCFFPFSYSFWPFPFHPVAHINIPMYTYLLYKKGPFFNATGAFRQIGIHIFFPYALPLPLETTIYHYSSSSPLVIIIIREEGLFFPFSSFFPLACSFHTYLTFPSIHSNSIEKATASFSLFLFFPQERSNREKS